MISDYESGRRKSPGIKVIKRYVDGLLTMDIKKGGQVIKSFMQPTQIDSLSNAVIDMMEFQTGIKIADFCAAIGADIVIKDMPGLDREIYGYTLIDSIKAISDQREHQR